MQAARAHSRSSTRTSSRRAIRPRRRVELIPLPIRLLSHSPALGTPASADKAASEGRAASPAASTSACRSSSGRATLRGLIRIDRGPLFFSEQRSRARPRTSSEVRLDSRAGRGTASRPRPLFAAKRAPPVPASMASSFVAGELAHTLERPRAPIEGRFDSTPYALRRERPPSIRFAFPLARPLPVIVPAPSARRPHRATAAGGRGSRRRCGPCEFNGTSARPPRPFGPTSSATLRRGDPIVSTTGRPFRAGADAGVARLLVVWRCAWVESGPCFAAGGGGGVESTAKKAAWVGIPCSARRRRIGAGIPGSSILLVGGGGGGERTPIASSLRSISDSITTRSRPSRQAPRCRRHGTGEAPDLGLQPARRSA